ncbi:MAG: hypothetical protein IJF97_00815 [Eggerthellaceae bacterium]|nr:hypothetical protein [Eggerthellaceae bacterium]MBQ3342723.1 hypothetical protein [Kiritimatiellia bacterium]
MKAEVLKPFYDLETGLGCVPENCYDVGDTFEGTAARVNGLVEKGFVKKQPARKRAAKPRE